jgi:hypothetical protein
VRVNWVVSSTYQLDPTADPEKLKLVGPIWGSWRTWRSCSTDNVVCYDFAKSRELIDRAFQAVCNFYVPRKYYQDLGRPVGLKLYDGEFAHDIDFPEDIITLHLTAASSDIVLLLGFDFGEIPMPDDRYQKHRLQNQHGLSRSVISSHDNVQWVLIDHAGELDKSYQNIPNLTCDKMENALQLLI